MLTRILGALLIALAVWLATSDAWPCEGPGPDTTIPVEPPFSHAIRHGPADFSGFYEWVWDYGDGMELTTLRRIRPENIQDAVNWVIEINPLFLILTVPGKVRHVWIDRGGDWKGPGGKCKDIGRY